MVLSAICQEVQVLKLLWMEGKSETSEGRETMATTAPAEDKTQRKRLRVDEKSSGDLNSEEVTARDRSRDRDRSHWRRFHDSTPLGRSSDDVGRRRRDERKSRSPGSRRPLDARSRSYYQRNEYRNAGHGSKPDVPRVSERGRYDDKKGELDNKVLGRPTSFNLEKKDEKSHLRDDNERAWKHDGYYELECEAAPPVKKRPAFREKKMQVEDNAMDVPEYARPFNHGGFGLNSDKREEVRGYNSRVSNRYDRPSAGRGDRDLRRGDLISRTPDTSRYGIQPRDRYDNGGGARTRDNHNNVRHNGRNSLQPGGFQVEKWKHDLFDEANKSPNRKNEEEQIAKAEALLAL